jgi:hypothetical protein
VIHADLADPRRAAGRPDVLEELGVDGVSAQTLTFTAAGLPPGFSIASNGTISGTGSTLWDLHGDRDRD